MDRNSEEKKLKEIFGFEKFLDDQWSTIQKVFRGERILLIEKTGFGKSLCYQYPATQFKGVTVIFTPLIALMRDQIRFLQSKNISCAAINRGERILLIEKTGFGKSLCYQYPATQFKGVTVIFTPLIALMRDQIRFLQSKNISCAAITVIRQMMRIPE
jgi:superfamily II DNA helicase RecQ